MKPRGARKPSAFFVLSVRISWLLRRMSVNLAEAIQTKHVTTFGLVALGTNGASVSYCLAMVKHRMVEYSVHFWGGLRSWEKQRVSAELHPLAPSA